MIDGKLFVCSHVFFLQTLEDSRIISARASARELWMEILSLVRQMNELSTKLADPNIFKEHLRLIFRDKSELSNEFGNLVFHPAFNTSLCLINSQFLLQL